MLSGRTVLDGSATLLQNRAVDVTRRRGTAIACVMSWALGPAIGIGLAAHELEDHGSEPQDHSHAAQAAMAIVHGHFHEEEADDHDHGIAPSSFSASRLAGESHLAASVPTAVGPQPPSVSLRNGRRPPEPAGLSPPSLFGLCVLRL